VYLLCYAKIAHEFELMKFVQDILYSVTLVTANRMVKVGRN